jgi:quercetin dioxygenase-like cupin family protein
MKWHLEKLDNKISFDQDQSDHRLLIAQSGRLESKMVCYARGQSTPAHQHEAQDEIFHVIQGRGTIVLDGEKMLLEPLTAVFVPAGTRHGIRAGQDSTLVITFVKSPGKGRKIAG